MDLEGGRSERLVRIITKVILGIDVGERLRVVLVLELPLRRLPGALSLIYVNLDVILSLDGKRFRRVRSLSYVGSIVMPRTTLTITFG